MTSAVMPASASSAQIVPVPVSPAFGAVTLLPPLFAESLPDTCVCVLSEAVVSSAGAVVSSAGAFSVKVLG